MLGHMHTRRAAYRVWESERGVRRLQRTHTETHTNSGSRVRGRRVVYDGTAYVGTYIVYIYIYSLLNASLSGHVGVSFRGPIKVNTRVVDSRKHQGARGDTNAAFTCETG